MPSAARVLLLAGTTEATALTVVLEPRDDVEITVSFAGRTSHPKSIANQQRVGGFGGSEGLRRYITENHIDVVIDATHPFAARMRWNAHAACQQLAVPRIRIERPPWTPSQGDRWREVSTLAEAPAMLGDATRVFLTTGRQDLEPFAAMSDTWFLVRSIERPDPMPLANAEVILERGPFTLDHERSLFQRRAVDALVTKNSGGDAASAKLVVARELGVDVVMINRPPSPPGPQVTSVEDALPWLERVLASR